MTLLTDVANLRRLPPPVSSCDSCDAPVATPLAHRRGCGFGVVEWCRCELLCPDCAP